MRNVHKIPNIYLEYKLLKIRNFFVLDFPELLDKKERENANYNKFTEHSMFEATDLSQPRKLYTAASYMVETFRRSAPSLFFNKFLLNYTPYSITLKYLPKWAIYI